MYHWDQLEFKILLIAPSCLCYLTIHQPANFTFSVKYKVIYCIVGYYLFDLSGYQRSLSAFLDYVDDLGSVWGSWWLVLQSSRALNKRLTWVPIIWINTQECKAGFPSECFEHYELSLVSPSAWTTLMGLAAPQPSSLPFPCSLAKRRFSGCAVQDHAYHELRALRPKHQGMKRRTAGQEVVFHSWHRWQKCCASNAMFSPLPRWGDAMQRVLHQWCLWEGWRGSRDVWSSWGPGPTGKVRAMGKWTVAPAVLCSSSKAAGFPFHTAADMKYAFSFANSKTNRETNKHWRFYCFPVLQNPIFHWKNM